jgi:MarR family transcriptional regulator, organic hydroperoxide resistance regulator
MSLSQPPRLVLPPGLQRDVDKIVEVIVYLYTESRRLTKEVARASNLTGPQLTVVKMLHHLGDLSLSELSERIRAGNSTVSGIIDRMEREELVKRVRSKEDRRVVHIKLTEKGRELAKSVPIQPMEFFQAAIASLDPEELTTVLRILTKLAGRVDELVKATNASTSPSPEETSK